MEELIGLVKRLAEVVKEHTDTVAEMHEVEDIIYYLNCLKEEIKE